MLASTAASSGIEWELFYRGAQKYRWPLLTKKYGRRGSVKKGELRTPAEEMDELDKGGRRE
ncbi:hypothetical protein PAMA_012238 [Pampus argenteus]